MPLNETLKVIANLSPAQHAMLRTLSQIGQQATIATIAERSGLHPNSARETLDVLLQYQLVQRHRLPQVGRGRPAWVYEVSSPNPDDGFLRQLSGFVQSTIKTFLLNEPNRVELAKQLGRTWGSHYVSSANIPDHRQFRRLRHPREIDFHISKVRVFLASLGFKARAGEGLADILVQSFPVWSTQPDTQALVVLIYQEFISAVLEHLSRGTVQIEFLPGLADEEGYLYLLRLHFRRPS